MSNKYNELVIEYGYRGKEKIVKFKKNLDYAKYRLC